MPGQAHWRPAQKKCFSHHVAGAATRVPSGYVVLQPPKLNFLTIIQTATYQFRFSIGPNCPESNNAKYDDT